MLLPRVLWLSVCLAAACFAQLGTATISGTIRDSSGAVLPAADVLVISSTTGFQRATTSNSVGEFSLPGLTPGSYDLTVKRQGFKTYQSKNLILQVDQNAAIDIEMQVGQLTETVEIMAQIQLVDSQTSSLGAVIDTQKILALPLNGRNFVELALLVPGANTGAPGRVRAARLRVTTHLLSHFAQGVAITSIGHARIWNWRSAHCRLRRRFSVSPRVILVAPSQASSTTSHPWKAFLRR